jgi:hypothetical protein
MKDRHRLSVLPPLSAHNLLCSGLIVRDLRRCSRGAEFLYAPSNVHELNEIRSLDTSRFLSFSIQRRGDISATCHIRASLQTIRQYYQAFIMPSQLCALFPGHALDLGPVLE